ncbi:hypothetical protein [Nostoc sp.]
MEGKERKYNSQIEINDLIDDAVKNAMTRRNEVLLSMSDEEAKSVAGGASKLVPIIVGKIFIPVTVGLVATEPLPLS